MSTVYSSWIQTTFTVPNHALQSGSQNRPSAALHCGSGQEKKALEGLGGGCPLANHLANCPLLQAIDRVNRRLQRLALTDPMIHYVDCSAGFLSASSAADGAHILAVGLVTDRRAD
jgi:hypothetical protein